MTIELADDGTMDTVLRCSECGKEFRFTYQPRPEAFAELVAGTAQEAEATYHAWIDECVEEVESEHVCPTYHVQTWFERDRQHVALYYGSEGDANDALIVEWWDEDVTEAVEDGFLDPRDWLGSALAYAESVGLTTKGRK